jgi:hypothetical protein
MKLVISAGQAVAEGGPEDLAEFLVAMLRAFNPPKAEPNWGPAPSVEVGPPAPPAEEPPPPEVPPEPFVVVDELPLNAKPKPRRKDPPAPSKKAKPAKVPKSARHSRGGRRERTPDAVRVRVLKLAAKGKSVREIMEATGLSAASVRRFSKAAAPPPEPTSPKPAPKRELRTPPRPYYPPGPAPGPMVGEPDIIPPPPPPKPGVRYETLTKPDQVMEVLNTHFAGRPIFGLAKSMGTTLPILWNTIRRAYELMGDEPFSPTAPPGARVRATWVDSLGDGTRANLAKRIAEGR